ncbi:MAG TPA: TolC family protein [Thermoanaerobaculia bacterium]|nr:TolC family protein [Thermoanaerobaculia bacterium]
MKRILFLLLIAQPLLAIDFNDPRSLVAVAIEKHPSLVRLRAEAGAARERIEPAAALPNPMVMAGVQNKQLDLRDDEMMTMYMVGASQTLVRPEKREARREAAELEAHAVESELASMRAEIERDVLLAWYDLAAADAHINAAEMVREMIAAVVAAARVRYEVGNAAQGEVIRAQLQQSNLEHDLLRLRGVRRAALARLLPLLELPLSTDVPRVVIPEHTDDLTIDAPATPPADHPAIVALETEVARAEAELRLARADAKPDIDLEAQYGYRRLQRDMFSLTARVELPLRRDVTIEPRVREAILRRDAAKARIAELRRTLVQAMGEAIVAHEEATSQMKFHHEVLVPQAQLAFESTLAAYQTGAASFESMLDTETSYLRLRLEYYEFLAQHAQAVVNYEALRRGARSMQ